MIQLDPAAVEAAAEAIYAEWDRQLFERGAIPFRLPWAMAEDVAKERYRLSAHPAITSYLAAIEPQVRAAVDALMTASSNAEATHLMSSARIEAEARAALFALLGMKGGGDQ